MFEQEADYRKAKSECKARITKVIKVWSGREEAIRDASFKDGAEFGYHKAIEWHDLRKDPDDLPPVHATVIVYGYLGDMKDLQGFDEWDGEKWTNEDMPGFVRVAWCEIPTFGEA